MPAAGGCGHQHAHTVNRRTDSGRRIGRLILERLAEFQGAHLAQPWSPAPGYAGLHLHAISPPAHASTHTAASQHQLRSGTEAQQQQGGSRAQAAGAPCPPEPLPRSQHTVSSRRLLGTASCSSATTAAQSQRAPHRVPMAAQDATCTLVQLHALWPVLYGSAQHQTRVRA